VQLQAVIPSKLARIDGPRWLAARIATINMANFAFIHGAGDVGWYWHLVEDELRAAGHDTVAPDLPTEDDTAGLTGYALVVVDAIRDRRDPIVVAQSFGGYVAPIVAERLDARLIVLVAGMIPSPGESAEEMFTNTAWAPGRQEDSSERAIFYHDVPPELADEALSRGRGQSDTPGAEPWPLPAWPDILTRFVLCRNDRFFPARWLRPLVRERLGVEPDEIDSGHCPALGHPKELAELLDRYASERLSVAQT
jgi:pimeloyl-ACP methyl ester carboxylesterase